ncbi:cell division protein FtsZ [Candidatus Caldatribacterium saccharofermentans]|uniref:Cell division protein FtsZ n=1 Tax=Candidatus Caldatribacterium saccharofermentans TaxID=1454753 RepID=A0A7V4THB4_9BACT
MKKKSLKRGFSERLDFKRELIRDTTKGIEDSEDVDVALSPPKSPTGGKSTKKPAEKPRERKVEDRVATIKVIGVGGGGNNAINHMIEEGLDGVDLVAVNTDVQSLKRSLAPEKVQIGFNLTRGLGTGGDPRIGEEAAKQDRDKLLQVVEDADLVFIAACMGGGTGTGAAPVIASLAKEAGALTLGVVTKPFNFEGSRRRSQAEEGIKKLQEVVDALIVIPNERLLQVAKKDTSLQEAFKVADHVLYQAVRGITDLITSPQDINLDLADLRTVLSGAGMVLIGIGNGRGREKARQAVEEAINSPLLEISVKGARSIILNVTGGPDMTLNEVTEIVNFVTAETGTETDILWGCKVDETLSNEIVVTVIATRFEAEGHEEELLSLAGGKDEEGIESRIIIDDDIDIPAFLRESQKRATFQERKTNDVFPFFRRMKGE